MAEKQLIVAIEGSAAMGPFWQTIVSDYLEKIIRSFCCVDLGGQKPSAPNFELSLVMFNAHGSYSACLVQRSGWTKDVDTFLHWLSAIPFAGGGFSDAAIAEGLAEALMMFSNASNANQIPPNADGSKHCILVAASNPYPLPTPVYRPLKIVEKGEDNEAQPLAESRLSDAEAVAISYAQCAVSLSIICPKQLPKLRAIFNVARRNPHGADPPVDNVKNPQHLILLSENFMEARAALSRPGITSFPSNQSPVKMDVPTAPPGTPPTSNPTVNGSIMNRQPISAANIPIATVKAEPTTLTSGAYPHVPSHSRPASQGVPILPTSTPSAVSQEMISSGDGVQDLKPIVSNISQSLRPVNPAAANVSILNNLNQARQVMHSAALTGGASIGIQAQNFMAMHMSNVISSGMQSSIPAAQNVHSSGQSSISSITGSETLSGAPQAVQNPPPGSFTSATSNITGTSNLGISQSLGNLQGGASIGQSVSGMSQGTLPGTQIVQNGAGMNRGTMSDLVPSSISSGTGALIPNPGMSQQVQPGIQSLAMSNSLAANMPLSQQASTSALQSAQSKYVKVWEGNLSGQRQGQPVFITRLEGYRSASASETLAANWPVTMQIVRLISQDHMNNKQYVGKADFLVFRAMNQHGFLGQLQEKKLCAVIQLPSQTLLLSVSDKACRLIGMLFPGDMVVFKPQPQVQQNPQMQQQMQQLPQMQQQQQLQQMQQQQLQQQVPQMQQQQQQVPQMQQQQQQVPQMQQQPQPQQQQLQQQVPQMQQQQQQVPQMQQQPQQHPQMQQQQVQQMQQQMVGKGMGQAYGQGPGPGPGRAQLVSQGQVPSQAPQQNLPRSGYLT